MSVFREVVTSPRIGLVSAVQAGAFWGAILLPFAYLPLLAVGLDSLDRQLLFASLLSLNIILLIIGHSHRTN